jgi:hypothetical protein
VNLVLRNPLDAEVDLTKLTLAVEERGSQGNVSAQDAADVEVIDEIILGPRETRTVRPHPSLLTSSRALTSTSDTHLYQIVAARIPLHHSAYIRLSGAPAYNGISCLPRPQTAGDSAPTTERCVRSRRPPQPRRRSRHSQTARELCRRRAIGFVPRRTQGVGVVDHEFGKYERR